MKVVNKERHFSRNHCQYKTIYVLQVNPMIKNKNREPENGALTSSMNVKNREFKEFQLFMKNKAASLNEKQKLQLELFALQIKVEDYLNAHQDEKK